MSIAARLSAWWSAWQVVFWLVVMIALLAALNVWQWKRAITAPLRGQVAGLEQAIDDAAAILDDKTATSKRTAADARAAAKQLASASAAYSKAVKDRPMTAPQCAPGQARVDAVNRAMGAQQEK